MRLDSLFDLLSLVYTLLSARTLYRLVRNWRTFTDRKLTAADRALATEVAFFLLVPIGVLLHETGHALATLQVGGQVVDFQWRVFWGYVLPAGQFTTLQHWWIFFSGNLVSFLYGLALLPLLWANVGPMPKYLAAQFTRIQLSYTLLFYPLITLLGFEGDWLAIYLLPPPVVSGALLVVHVALVVGLLRVERSAWFRRWLFTLGVEAGRAFQQAEAAVKAQPHAIGPRVSLGNYYFDHHELDLAAAQYRQAMRLDPANFRPYYNLALVELRRKHARQAIKLLHQALERLPVGHPAAPELSMSLAIAHLERNRPRLAGQALDRASPGSELNPEMHYWRGVVHKRLRQRDAARTAFQRAAELAGDAPLGEMARRELASL